MIKTFFAFLLIITMAFSCSSTDNDCADSLAEIRDMSNLDGCTYVLVMNLEDEWRTLEPINLDSFGITPSNGLEVCISFEVRSDLASICQVGEIVELTSMELK